MNSTTFLKKRKIRKKATPYELTLSEFTWIWGEFFACPSVILEKKRYRDLLDKHVVNKPTGPVLPIYEKAPLFFKLAAAHIALQRIGTTWFFTLNLPRRMEALVEHDKEKRRYVQDQITRKLKAAFQCDPVYYWFVWQNSVYSNSRQKGGFQNRSSKARWHIHGALTLLDAPRARSTDIALALEAVSKKRKSYNNSKTVVVEPITNAIGAVEYVCRGSRTQQALHPDLRMEVISRDLSPHVVEVYEEMRFLRHFYTSIRKQIEQSVTMIEDAN